MMFPSIHPSARSHPLISIAIHTYQILAHEKDLSPHNPLINHTLQHFVETVSSYHAEKEAESVLELEGVRTFMTCFYELLGRSEEEMEKYYADRYNQLSSIRLGDLSQFVYWHNYITLVREEVQVYFKMNPDWRGKKIAFVGSGALPLSPLLFHLFTSASVTLFDSDIEAVNRSRIFIEKCGLKDKIQIMHIRGEEAYYSDYAFVFVASLVQPKEHVLAQIRLTQPTAGVAIRSSEGVYQLLYEPVSIWMLNEMGYQVWDQTIANPNMINTTLFLKPI